jgi:hypothetical protein
VCLILGMAGLIGVVLLTLSLGRQWGALLVPISLMFFVFALLMYLMEWNRRTGND